MSQLPERCPTCGGAIKYDLRGEVPILAPVPSAEALKNIKIWAPYGKPTITLQIPGRGFWSYYPSSDDRDGGAFMLEFQKHFCIKGVE